MGHEGGVQLYLMSYIPYLFIKPEKFHSLFIF